MALRGRHLIGGNGRKGAVDTPAAVSSLTMVSEGHGESPAEAFGLWVWARRKALRRSRREVARRARLDEDTLRALETGLLSLEETLALLPALAQGLDLSPACLYRRWKGLVVSCLDAGPEDQQGEG